ncbi:hypothetical protein BLNAU_24709 [Blattamonas nauphoetae]|uniref:Uncharacterized protein n=1 Tax=Blattamonas nauphoetae TaxID=2049346 RepID=A0ABQ9WLN0_9EUKA|nr:hypothetical protein BLNAU_24709 [Blattamonas nauphoetae]
MPPKKRPCIHSCIQGAHENITQCKLLRQTNFEHGLHQIQPDDLRSPNSSTLVARVSRFANHLCDEENRASLAPSSPHCLSANRIAAHRFSTASNSAHPNRHLSQTLQTLARRSPCTTLEWCGSVLSEKRRMCVGLREERYDRMRANLHNETDAMHSGRYSKLDTKRKRRRDVFCQQAFPANQTQTPPNTNSSSSSPSTTPSTSPPDTNDTTAVSTSTPDELASLPCKDRCERLFEIQVAECGEDRECQMRHRKRRFDCVNECSLDTPTPSQADTEPSQNSTGHTFQIRASGKGGIDACRDQPKQCETRCHTPLTAEQQCQEACRTTFLQCTSVCGTDKNNKTGAGEKACLMQCRAYRSDCRSMCSNSEKEEENGLCGECEASCETDHEICVENCKRNENCIEMCRTQRKDCKEDCHSPNSDYAERKKAEELAKEEERLIGHLGIHSKCEEECDGRS